MERGRLYVPPSQGSAVFIHSNMAMAMVEAAMIYLGERGGVSVYQPEYDPQTWERERFPLPLVYKCNECKIRWFRAITNFYGGLCHPCYVSQYEGEEEMLL